MPRTIGGEARESSPLRKSSRVRHPSVRLRPPVPIFTELTETTSETGASTARDTTTREEAKEEGDIDHLTHAHEQSERKGESERPSSPTPHAFESVSAATPLAAPDADADAASALLTSSPSIAATSHRPTGATPTSDAPAAATPHTNSSPPGLRSLPYPSHPLPSSAADLPSLVAPELPTPSFDARRLRVPPQMQLALSVLRQQESVASFAPRDRVQVRLPMVDPADPSRALLTSAPMLDADEPAPRRDIFDQPAFRQMKEQRQDLTLDWLGVTEEESRMRRERQLPLGGDRDARDCRREVGRSTHSDTLSDVFSCCLHSMTVHTFTSDECDHWQHDALQSLRSSLSSEVSSARDSSLSALDESLLHSLRITGETIDAEVREADIEFDAADTLSSTSNRTHIEVIEDEEDEEEAGQAGAMEAAADEIAQEAVDDMEAKERDEQSHVKLHLVDATLHLAASPPSSNGDRNESSLSLVVSAADLRPMDTDAQSGTHKDSEARMHPLVPDSSVSSHLHDTPPSAAVFAPLPSPSAAPAPSATMMRTLPSHLPSTPSSSPTTSPVQPSGMKGPSIPPSTEHQVGTFVHAPPRLQSPMRTSPSPPSPPHILHPPVTIDASLPAASTLTPTLVTPVFADPDQFLPAHEYAVDVDEECINLVRTRQPGEGG